MMVMEVMNELKVTIETLIELDEPEALLRTLRNAVARKKGERWQALSHVLDEADWKLDQLLNAKPAGPDFRPQPAHDTEISQPQPAGADHGNATAEQAVQPSAVADAQPAASPSAA